MVSSSRSKQAEAYRHLYSTSSWRELRAFVLNRDAYTCQVDGCGVFLTTGRDQPNSAVVHHKTPHKGNTQLFFDVDNLEAVCWSCHSSHLQKEEANAHKPVFGADGWPEGGVGQISDCAISKPATIPKKKCVPDINRSLQ